MWIMWAAMWIRFNSKPTLWLFQFCLRPFCSDTLAAHQAAWGKSWENIQHRNLQVSCFPLENMQHQRPGQKSKNFLKRGPHKGIFISGYISVYAL